MSETAYRTEIAYKCDINGILIMKFLSINAWVYVEVQGQVLTR